MRVAVVGTGFISTLVAPKIVRWGYTVTDVVSTPRSLTKAQELAGPLGARASCDYDAVLAREDVDAVYLGIPNDLHHDYATRALRAGKHVILEKPMGTLRASAAFCCLTPPPRSTCPPRAGWRSGCRSWAT